MFICYNENSVEVSSILKEYKMDYSNLKVPNHVALIVDGNGRWATERGLS